MLIASKKWEGYNLSLVRNRAINPALCLAGFVTRFPGNINLSIPSKDVDGVRRKETWAGQRLTGKVRDRRRLSQWLTFPFPFVHHQPWKEEVDVTARPNLALAYKPYLFLENVREIEVGRWRAVSGRDKRPGWRGQEKTEDYQPWKRELVGW